MQSTPSDASARDALEAIRDNIEFAYGFVAGRPAETFMADRMAVYATIRALEVISEASRRLPQQLRDRHPHLPWRAIRDVGNFYRHEYESIDVALVWQTASHRLGPLLAAVSLEIERLDPGA